MATKERGVQPKRIKKNHLWCYRCHEVKHRRDYPDDVRSRSRFRDFKSIFCAPCTREYRREYKTKNREKFLSGERAWRAKNAAKLTAYKQSRRTREGGPPAGEVVEWMAILRSDPCSYCGGPGGSVDHVQPVLFGGRTEVNNLASTCRPCNSSKGSKPLLAWLVQRSA